MFHKTELEKQRAQLKRVLREFPWLWAVNPVWTPGHHQVFIQEISNDYLFEDSSERCRWWAKINSGRALEQVVTVPHMEGANVASAIISSFSIGYMIQHLVMSREYHPPTLFLFRASRGESLHKMVCAAAFAKEQ